MSAPERNKHWRPVVEPEDSDTWVDRAMLAIYRAVDRLPEKGQLAFLLVVGISGSALTAFVDMPSGWRLASASLTVSASSLLTLFIVLSVVVNSPRWRLLELQHDLADLRRMTGLEFEQFVAELLEARGFAVTRKGGARPDGGVDMLASQSGRTYIVQCKQLTPMDWPPSYSAALRRRDQLSIGRWGHIRDHRALLARGPRF